MTGKRWLIPLALSALAVGVGCVSIRHQAAEESVHPGTPLPHPPFVRQRVYLFMMNGHGHLELARMLSLRDELCRNGFPKVYYAQLQDVDWYYREARRVAHDEPDARILFLAYGAGADRVRTLAAGAVRDGLPVDAVIFLDPVGLNGNLAETLPVHTVILRSHHWLGSRGLAAAEQSTLTGVGHRSLPTHPMTVGWILDLMTASADQVPVRDPRLYLPHLPLSDHPDPTPRPIDPATLIPVEPEWDFLRPTRRPDELPGVSIPSIEFGK
jgi:hypothetical protein